MKKNRMMRLASVLLVLTLLTTSVISGTFAKYVTSNDQLDEARVAKWGVTASVTGDLFGATYSKATDNSIITYAKNGGTVSSSVGKADFVVAPGTKNDEGLTVSVTGTPEVSAQIIVDSAEDANGNDYGNSDIYLAQGQYGVMVKYEGVVTRDNITKYYVDRGTVFTNAHPAEITREDLVLYELVDIATVADEDYYPLNWYVNGKKVENQQAVKDALTALQSEELTPNTKLDRSTTITWDWNFNKPWADVGGNQEQTSQEDKMDTILGNMIAAHQGSEIKVVKATSDTAVMYHHVKYKVEKVEDGINEAVYVYAGGNKIACLTVALNVRLTVTQID